VSAADLTQDILRRIAKLHPPKIDLSLDRIKRLLAALGHPQERMPPVIHVAGTNGKGSTVAFLRAILEAGGYRVHVDTSPHLVRVNERIRLAGTLVDDEKLAATLAECERVNDGATISIWEMLTAAALLLFSRVPADFTLLEVGLGGRFDATNVVSKPRATIITPVSFDHPEFLGKTVEKIAFEKAGILKPGALAVIAEQAEGALAVIERRALQLGVRRRVAERDFFVRAENGRLVFEDANGLLDLPKPRLAGRHQYGNAAVAVATLRELLPELPAAAFERGLSEAQWPARLQRLKSGPLADHSPPGAELWLDGAHNEAGGRVLAEAMADFEEAGSRPLVMICGTLSTKDTGAFLRHFKGLVREVIAVPVPGEHAARAPQEVADFARAAGLATRLASSVSAALDALKGEEWAKPPRVLIAGSLYLAGAVLAENGQAPT
jgi:dihydrofolate synthase/folylpolyglutamate synthase